MLLPQSSTTMQNNCANRAICLRPNLRTVQSPSSGLYIALRLLDEQMGIC